MSSTYPVGQCRLTDLDFGTGEYAPQPRSCTGLSRVQSMVEKADGMTFVRLATEYGYLDTCARGGKQ